MATITASLERSLQNCSISVTSPPLQDELQNRAAADASTLELNSLWEQCLDLKTGEIYYINWRNGKKTKEDPGKTADGFNGVSEESDDFSSTSSSPHPCSIDDFHSEEDNVLVVAGCKSCLMYFMLPKKIEECPKCNSLLLHFNRPENDVYE